jgi:hypothetical protein
VALGKIEGLQMSKERANDLARKCTELARQGRLIERNDLATMAIGYQSKPPHEERAIRPRPKRGFFSGVVRAATSWFR